MTTLATVEADNSGAIGVLDRILRTELLGMTKLLTVGALGHQAVNDMTGIRQSFNVYLRGLWPKLTVLATTRLVRSVPGDTIGLLEVSLGIHENFSGLGLLLDGDQVDWKAQLTE